MTQTARRMLVSALFAFTLGGTTRAGYVVNLAEAGGNVIAIGSGTINISSLTNYIGGGISPGLDPSAGFAYFGQHSNFEAFSGSSFIGPTSFGSGGPFYHPLTGSGDIVGIDFALGSVAEVGVPANYVSGSMLSSVDVFLGQTFASLGLTPGTYTWTWGAGANADFFTMNIGAVAVPEPSSLLPAAGGLGAVGLAARARRRRATRLGSGKRL